MYWHPSKTAKVNAVTYNSESKAQQIWCASAVFRPLETFHIILSCHLLTFTYTLTNVVLVGRFKSAATICTSKCCGLLIEAACCHRCDCFLDGLNGPLCNVTSEQSCIAQCSGHGHCQRGWCKCFPGYYGHDCAQRRDDTAPIDSESTASAASTWLITLCLCKVRTCYLL